MSGASTSVALDGRAILAANSALRFMAVTARHFGARAPLRQVELLLLIATREPVDRRTLTEAGSGRSKAALDDLHRLCATDRDGKPGLGFILTRPKPGDYRSVQYVLTARGRRAVSQITAAIEALDHGGCGTAPRIDDRSDEVLSYDSVVSEGLAPVQAASDQSPGLAAPESVAPAESPLIPRIARSLRPQRRITDPERTSNLPRFKYKGTPVRAVQSEGVAWFVAGDVCKCLDRDTSAGTAKALRYIEPADRCVLVHTAVPAGFLGARCYEVSVVSSAGLLKLIGRTRGGQARAFEQWVRHRILPRLPANLRP